MRGGAARRVRPGRAAVRVLVIGNSQVAALRAAVADALPEGRTGAARHGGNDYLFYAQFGGGGPNLYARDGRLAAPRVLTGSFTTIPDGRVEDGLALEGFDAIVVSAVGLRADRSDPRHLLSGPDVADLAVAPGVRSVSRGLFARMVGFETVDAPQWRAILAIRSLFSGPLLFQPFPLPTEGVLARDDFASARRYGPRTGEFLALYYREMMRATRANAAALSPPAVVMPHPDPAWTEAGFTAAAYGTRDPWHMNAHYGALVLDQVAAALIPAAASPA